MSLNLFIAVACVVAAILLTIATVRFFFSARKPQVQDAFKDQPAGAHASAGDTLRTRRSDNRESIVLLTRQLVVSAILTLLVLLPALVRALYPNVVPSWMVDPWVQAIIITPVMFYGGAPIHIDGWDALLRRMPNMNSLASIGTIAAYAYGILVCLFESALPQAMREPYFEVTGVIVTLVLFARWAVDMWLPRRPAFPLQERVDRVSRVWVPITILIALWTFVCWLIFGPQPSFTRALLMGVSVLIITCPAALGWAAPLSAGAALDDAQRYGLTVRTTSALQQAKDTSAVLVSRELAPSAEQAIAQLSGTGVAVA
ncbi:ATPase P, partial [Bifidobacterium pseudolongum]